MCVGLWGVGLATRKCDINVVPLGADTDSWVLRQDGTMFHNNEQKGKLTDVPQEGDVVVSLQFAQLYGYEQILCIPMCMFFVNFVFRYTVLIYAEVCVHVHTSLTGVGGGAGGGGIN